MTHPMKLIRIHDRPRPADRAVFADALMEGAQGRVRLIRLGPGQTLPPHRHGVSELMLYAVSGSGALDTDAGVVPFNEGALACYSGAEELRVRNTGGGDLTLLAFLAPKFPPARGAERA
jgi:quercetin dioxygenase-like cupin family protein